MFVCSNKETVEKTETLWRKYSNYIYTIHIIIYMFIMLLLPGFPVLIAHNTTIVWDTLYILQINWWSSDSTNHHHPPYVWLEWSYDLVRGAKRTCLSKKWEDERQLDNIQIKYESVIKLSLWNLGIHNSADSNKVWHFPIEGKCQSEETKSMPSLYKIWKLTSDFLSDRCFIIW